MSAWNDHLQRLVELLAEQHGLYGELEEQLALQRQAVLAQDTEALEAATAAVERLGRLMRGAERRRQRVLAGLAEGLGLPVESLGLRRLAALGSPAQARRLTQLGHELRLRLGRVESLRSRLAVLLERSAHFARRQVEQLAGLGQPPGSYGPDARVRSQGGDGRLIDRRI
jgi:hypothetical protein